MFNSKWALLYRDLGSACIACGVAPYMMYAQVAGYIYLLVFENDTHFLPNISSSYGLYWGISGYMMLARNRGNMCGVATEAGLPIP